MGLRVHPFWIKSMLQPEEPLIAQKMLDQITKETFNVV
jgi:hypothetical protein